MTSEVDATTKAGAFKRLYPDEYYSRFLEDGIRPDGRCLDATRDANVGLGAVSNSNGSALARIGDTSVLAGCRLEVFVPDDLHPDEGQLQVSVELTPISSAAFKPGRPPDLIHSVQQRLQDVLLKGRVIDLRQLCLEATRVAWMLYLDLYILNADGSVLDACLLAAMSALADLRFPLVTITSEGNVECAAPSEESDKTPAGLQLRRTPLSLTFAQYKGKIIADPTTDEELLASSLITIVVDEEGGLHGILKPGGGDQLPSSLLLTCIKLANMRHKELMEVITEVLEAKKAEVDMDEEEDGT